MEIGKIYISNAKLVGFLQMIAKAILAVAFVGLVVITVVLPDSSETKINSIEQNSTN